MLKMISFYIFQVGRNLKNPAHPKLNEFLYYL